MLTDTDGRTDWHDEASSRFLQLCERASKVNAVTLQERGKTEKRQISMCND